MNSQYTIQDIGELYTKELVNPLISYDLIKYKNYQLPQNENGIKLKDYKYEQFEHFVLYEKYSNHIGIYLAEGNIKTLLGTKDIFLITLFGIFGRIILTIPKKYVDMETIEQLYSKIEQEIINNLDFINKKLYEINQNTESKIEDILIYLSLNIPDIFEGVDGIISGIFIQDTWRELKNHINDFKITNHSKYRIKEQKDTIIEYNL